MEIVQVILLIIVILLVVWIIRSFTKKSNKSLTGIKDATKEQDIAASKLPDDSQTSNYSYSIWFYVQDWSYRFGEEKTLLSRGDTGEFGSTISPKIVLGAMENNIRISISCYPRTNSDEPLMHICSLSNFPLQKWVNLIISLNGQTLDVYIDGKLTRTCLLPGVAKSDPDADIKVTPDGGFNGYTAKLQYWDKPKNPQQAYNIYKAGFGSTSGSLFDKYKVRVQFLEDNQVEGQFTL